MINDQINGGSERKSPSKVLMLTIIVLILVVLGGGAYYWFGLRPTATSIIQKTDFIKTQPKKVDAVKVETIQAQSPLFGTVNSINEKMITIEEIHIPFPGETNNEQKTGKLFTLKITDTPTATLLTKAQDGSLKNSDGKIADIKVGSYILTPVLDSTDTQPFELSSIQYSDINPF